MRLTNLQNFGVVILAAGKGTRLHCQELDVPKVMLPIGGRPIASYIVETLYQVGFASEQICLVVGYKKEEVFSYFGERVIYAVQEEQLGTAHAAYTGIKILPDSARDVLVINGDDSAFYKPATVETLLKKHIENKVMATLLSTDIESTSFAYGRVLRKADHGVDIIEKEYLTEENMNIIETSTGTFCFNRVWYENIYPNMPKLEKLGEYGLPTAFIMAQKEGLAVQVVKLEDSSEWFGINTKEELAEADRRKKLFL